MDSRLRYMKLNAVCPILPFSMYQLRRQQGGLSSMEFTNFGYRLRQDNDYRGIMAQIKYREATQVDR